MPAQAAQGGKLIVKLVFVGIGVFIRAVVSASASLFASLLAGINDHLAGSPRLPFHSPLAQPVVVSVRSRLARVTSSVSRAAVLGLVALLLVSTVGTLVAPRVGRWMECRKRTAELDRRACVMAGRAQVPASMAEYEALWV